MSSLDSSVSLNGTFVRPSFFHINGFSNIPYVKYYYGFLSLVYAVTIIGNSFIMLIIYMAQSLHTPKYVAVFHLAVVDLCGSTALIPKIIETFLFDSPLITYEACLTSMFFVHFFSLMQSFTLVLLAYDRFVAICFPLKFHVFVTNTLMVMMIIVAWAFTAVLLIGGVVFFTRLSFCKSIVINGYFCDHGIVIRLACNDFSPNLVFAMISIAALFYVPLLVIVLSYVCIISALLKIASTSGCWKALKTCTSHLILVALFYFPLCGTYLASLTSYVHPNARIINTSLAAVIPPMLNPIIYTLKTQEIMEAIKMFYQRRKLHAMEK
ncbi:olfactory receptor 1E16-like [Amia ocellicauda]|uniref:olfactory receptor 1E16-like n=1 Tax=Amia ocellicauda TaxID=2972642 RepID=UPI003463C6ED